MNKKLLEGLESLKLDIRSGVANWGGKVYYFNEKDKAELIAEIDKFNPFERLAKPKKTLEELGWRFLEKNHEEGHIWCVFQKENREQIYLNVNGDIDFGWSPRTTLTKELYAAIEQEMKSRGWWK